MSRALSEDGSKGETLSIRVSKELAARLKEITRCRLLAALKEGREVPSDALGLGPLLREAAEGHGLAAIERKLGIAAGETRAVEPVQVKPSNHRAESAQERAPRPRKPSDDARIEARAKVRAAAGCSCPGATHRKGCSLRTSTPATPLGPQSAEPQAAE